MRTGNIQIRASKQSDTRSTDIGLVGFRIRPSYRSRSDRPSQILAAQNPWHDIRSRSPAGVIGRARRECLGRMLINGERHLRLTMSEYADHYNAHRPHRTPQQHPPAGRAHLPAEKAGMHILRRDWLGGLIHEYAQAA